MGMETAPAEAVELVVKVSAARDGLQAAPDDTTAKAATNPSVSNIVYSTVCMTVSRGYKK